MGAQVRRCAVLAAPDRRVASISKTIKCGQGSLRERARESERERRKQACDVVLYKDVVTEREHQHTMTAKKRLLTYSCCVRCRVA